MANEDTMLRTQMFPRLPARTTFVADTNLVSETQKMFLIFVRNILCPQQMFPRLRGMDTKQMFCVPLVCPPKKHHEQQCVRNNVSSFATTCTNCARAGINWWFSLSRNKKIKSKPFNDRSYEFQILSKINR